MNKNKVIIINIASALATTIVAIIFFLLDQEISIPPDAVLGMVAGFFIYIATDDIIPSIHHNEAKNLAGPQTILLLFGVVVVTLATFTLHGIINTA